MIGVNPLSNPAAYRKLYLAGTPSPGAIPRGGVEGFDIETDWEIKKGKAKDGATMTDGGDPPKKGKVMFQLWRRGIGGEPDDFADWDAYREMLRAARKAKAALDVQYPLINDQEVKSVVVGKIFTPKELRAGLWLAGVELLEWVPEPKKAGGTPGGSAAGKGDGSGSGAGEGTNAPSENAQTEAEKELAALAEQAGF